ncbi:CIS tube protein [Pyxidicoccus xibeiensis]|uniref:CIS tube protein n=1 Tax=Pyxidicoccus xibeiensis TaxID=2906759 RepID=UPI0020A79B4C|nr:hypothetical protein [Pyxidicoccus xibeiensis]MCP3137364.1 hypothetical protein [Pyxidicoccus xibeiensis]
MADDVAPLAKAKLIQLDASFTNPLSGGATADVQFNPETLKVSFANQVQQPSGGGGNGGGGGGGRSGDQRGQPAQQFVGAGTTKLAVQLWFDVTGQPEGKSGAVDDVRKLTGKVAFFMKPEKKPGSETEYLPPGVRFLWGSFKFDGIMESMEESLELFSSEGLPLRASVSFTLTQQKIDKYTFEPTKAPPASPARSPSGKPPGEAPMTPTPSGMSLQQLAAAVGKAGNWQAIAAANGIENPRQLAPGQLVDLQAGLKFGVKR